MGNSYKLLSLVLAIFFLSGCAGTPVVLDRSQIQENKIKQIEISVVQEKLEIEKSAAGTAGGAAGFGILGALVGAAVDSGINASRTKSIADVVSALGDYNFEETFINKMKSAEPNFIFSNNAEVINEQNKKPQPFVPFLEASYILSNDRNKITIMSFLNFDQQKEGSKNYSRLYISEHDIRLYGMTGENKDDKTAFLADNPNVITDILELGMDEVIELFSDDFGNNSFTQYNATETTTMITPIGLVLGKMKILNEKDNRTLLLSEKGFFPTIAYTSTSLVGKRKEIKDKK